MASLKDSRSSFAENSGLDVNKYKGKPFLIPNKLSPVRSPSRSRKTSASPITPPLYEKCRFSKNYLHAELKKLRDRHVNKQDIMLDNSRLVKNI